MSTDWPIILNKRLFMQVSEDWLEGTIGGSYLTDIHPAQHKLGTTTTFYAFGAMPPRGDYEAKPRYVLAEIVPVLGEKAWHLLSLVDEDYREEQDQVVEWLRL